MSYEKQQRDSREGVAVPYAVIQAHRGAFRVSLICRALQMSCSAFYKWTE